MVFSSLTFLYIFLPVTLVIYYIVPKQLRNLFILISGLFFYAWGEPIYVFVLIASTMIDYFAGLVIYKAGDRQALRKLALIVSMVMNLSLLGFFKYSNFIIENINNIFGTHYGSPTSLLPIGISFFTFQSMSYTIDLYRKNISVQKNPITFAAFVTLFPQIVAGPIVRYEDVAAELDERVIDIDLIWDGVLRFAVGLGKKVLIANNIGVVWTNVKAMNLSELPVATAWLGIHFPENFNYPYMSKSISEFWRRWHMTLSGWFKSYVYFPLGGSRKGLARTIFNTAVVWFLTGVWHGASWNFILWGSLYGVLIIIEKLVTTALTKAGKQDIFTKIPSIIKHVYAIVLVMLGWVLFDTSTIAQAFSYMGRMFHFGSNFYDSYTVYILVNFGLLFIVAIIGSTDLPKKLAVKLADKVPAVGNYGSVILMAVLMLLSTAYLVNASYNPFLYFNF